VTAAMFMNTIKHRIYMKNKRNYIMNLTGTLWRLLGGGGGKGVRYVGIKTVTTFMCRMPKNSGSFNLLEVPGPVQNCNVIALPLPYNKSNNLECYESLRFRRPLY